MQRAAFAKQELLTNADFEVSELNQSLNSIIDERKTGDFGFSYRAFHLYAQCGDQQQRSPGLLVRHGDAIFAVGLFQRGEELSTHLIAPRGEGWVDAIKSFADYCLGKGLVDFVYVRHLAPHQLSPLRRAGFDDIDKRPWLSDAASEDETYNHRLIHLNQILSPADSAKPLKSLQTTDSKNFRNKFRLAYGRFKNFLQREGVEYQLRPMLPEDYQHGCDIVQHHFRHLESAGKAIGSTAMDYGQLLAHPMKDGPGAISLLGWLVKNEERTPASVFLGEQTGAKSGALYLTITLRDEKLAACLGIADPRGYSAISQYAFGRVFTEAYKRGWNTVDLGGSETSDLDRFKRQMGATLHATHWMVMQASHKYYFGSGLRNQ